jgi:hypothetical protein
MPYFTSRDTFPEANRTQLRDLILELAAHSIVVGRSKVILRKLFVAVRLYHHTPLYDTDFRSL